MSADTLHLHDDMQLSSTTTETTVVKSGRLLSLDGLQGFDMFWIIGGHGIVTGRAKVRPGRFSTAVVRQLHHVR